MAMKFTTDTEEKATPEKKNWADKGGQPKAAPTTASKGGDEETSKFFEKPPHQQNVRVPTSCPMSQHVARLCMSPPEAGSKRATNE